jgi:serine/threonine-protein kinase
MNAVDANRNLLFGLLALQTGLIDQDQLMGAFRAWSRDPARSLADYLADRGELDPEQRAAVGVLVASHLKKHGGDAEKSLAAVSVAPSIRRSLAAVAAAPIGSTLVGLVFGPDGDANPDRTSSYAVGAPTSDGQRFRILRPHAQGGLGAVFVALDGELHREVALKQILDRHADDPTSRARFVLEAEITGGLEHPGIVPVYGLGMYADGRPYYAMRFIKGDSLKEAIERFHADEALKHDPGRRALELRKLLRRFLDVCNAIGYAHSRGVLHRDLKPGNVIVGKHGETLVVDWGLAKARGRADGDEPAEERPLTPSPASGSAETLPGQVLGTPAYMSPEQASGDPEALGAASDVYSLGATLYCLLTGRAPFKGDIGSVLRAVRRGAFPPPRASDPSVDRALEAICLKAMALRPPDRYASARALSEDVERWLADEPVSAWREPLPRRARRWARRNRTAVTAGAAAAAMALVGLSAVLLVQAQANRALAAKNLDLSLANRRVTQANQELQRANVALTDSNARERAARSQAQQRFDVAREAIEAYYTGVSEEVLLRQPELEALRAKLLGTALEFYRKLQTTLQQSGEADLRARAGLADATYRVAELTDAIGSKPKAGEGFRQALALYEALARAHPDDPDLRRRLSLCHNGYGLVLREVGDPAGALRAFVTARDLRRDLIRRRSEDIDIRRLANVLDNLGDLQRETGRPAEALATYREANALWEALHEADSDAEPSRNGLARNYQNLARLQGELGQVRVALESFGRARDLLRGLIESHPTIVGYRSDLAALLSNLGMLLFKSGSPAEALRAWEQYRALNEELVRLRPTVTRFRRSLAQAHNNIGVAQKALGRPDAALASYGQARDLQEQLVRTYPAVTEYRRALAGTYSNISVLFQESGRPDEALEASRRALALQEELVGAGTSFARYRRDLALSLSNLGALLGSLDRGDEAVRHLERALALQRALMADEPGILQYAADLAESYASLGVVLSRLGRRDEAWTALERARTTLEALPRLGPSERIVLSAALSQAAPLADRDHQRGGSAAGRHLGDRAMAQLREAIEAGYRNRRALETEPAFDPLRPRPDFQLLMMDLAMPGDPFARPD